MPFYPPRYRREPFQMTGQRFGPPMPNQFRGQNHFYSPSNQFSGQRNFLGPQSQLESRPYLNPYEQPPYDRAPMDFNTMMGHVGTITNGLSAMRQIGGIIGLFR